MSVRHVFQSGKADAGDTTLVQPSNWNADHQTPPFVIPMLLQHGIVAWTNMPAALTEYNAGNRTRIKCDLTNVDQVRLTIAVTTAGTATSEIRLQYATDGDTQNTWAFLDGADGPKANMGSVGARASAWAALVTGAKADVWVRAVGINGDGAIDPVVGNIVLHCR